jgi:ketosteroid isomerase-like protein
MSRENVELVHRWHEAWNRRDLDGMLAVFAPHVEFRPLRGFLGTDPVYVGHAGFRRFWTEFIAAWESFAVSEHELRDCGEQVLFLGTFEARARDGLEVRRPGAAVWSLREGRAVRVEVHDGWADALEAVGGSRR